MDKVELLPAYEFTCEYCGQLNYVRSAPQIESNGEDSVLLVPSSVKCKQCKTKYSTEFNFDPVYEE